MEKPFIHLFQSHMNYYMYDVNTDMIVRLPEKIYRFLKDGEKGRDEEAAVYVENLKKNGFLKTTRVKETENFATKLLPFYLSDKLNYLILQVTQNCNLRCEYCVYSGGYHTRGHSNKRMTFDLARQGIDYLIAHSADSEHLALGFYGGEPLLEFDLIKRCVSYIESAVEDKEIWLSLTTNATLLRGEIADYLARHDFAVTISLDGPKEIHDRNRKFSGKEKGSFDLLMENVMELKRRHPDYFKKKVMVNTVLDPAASFSCVNDYFAASEVFKETNIKASVINPDYRKGEIPVKEAFREEAGYEEFRFYLTSIGWLKQDNISPLLKQKLDEMKRLKIGKEHAHRKELPTKWHHGGPCIPAANRLFLNAYGDFYPCEKVCELSETARIGNIVEGIDVKKVENILNIERVNPQKCYECWAYEYCQICIRCADNEGSHLRELVDKECAVVRNNVESRFKDYCFLREMGYDFDTMKFAEARVSM